METRLSPIRGHLPAAVLAAAFLVGTLVAVAEIAAEPTPVAGIYSSSWTPLRGAASLVAGPDAFGGTLAAGPVLLGTALLFGFALILGLLGAVTLEWLLGPAPQPVAAAIAGGGWGLSVQVAVVLLFADALLDGGLMYEALPRWGWWLATGTWGIALGLLSSRGEEAGDAVVPTGTGGSPA